MGRVRTAVQGPRDLDAFLKWAEEQTESTFDTETLGLIDLRCVGLSMANETSSWAVVFGKPEEWTPSWNPDVVMQNPRFRKLFLDDEAWLVMHNAKFDLRVLKRYGVIPKARVFDTLIASFLVWEKGEHGLKFLSKTVLDREMGHWSEELYSPENRAQLIVYMLDDADAPWELRKVYKPLLEKEGLWYAFRIDCTLQRVLMNMEDTGFLLDRNYLEMAKIRLEWRMFAIERNVWSIVGKPFNLASPHDIGRILFKEMGIKPPPGSLSPTGRPSTKEKVLLRVVDLGGPAFLKDVLLYREYKKLHSTYVVGTLDRLREDGRIHTDFGICTVATGRLSSFNPNLQNLPRPTSDKFRIRDAFIAPPGKMLIVCDYSQLELRVLAHRAKDEVMIETFKSGVDIHQVTADGCGVSRQAAKSINFGIVYGLSPNSLAETLNVSKGKAADIIEKFFLKFSRIRPYMSRVKSETRELGYVRTVSGRKRRLPEIASKDFKLKAHAERQAVNTSIQGSASDIIKRAMIGMSMRLEPGDCDMLIQVHDEMVFECRIQSLERNIAIIKEEMEHPFREYLGGPVPKELACPLEIVPKVVRAWGLAK